MIAHINKIILAVVSLSVIVALVATLFVPMEVIGQTALSQTTAAKKSSQKTEVPQKAPAPVGPMVIPVPQIASKATEATNLIRDINTKLAPNPFIESISTQLPQKAKLISHKLSETKKALQSEPTLAVLQNLQQIWQQLQSDICMCSFFMRSRMAGERSAEIMSFLTWDYPPA
jgi:hypothetical protein